MAANKKVSVELYLLQLPDQELLRWQLFENPPEKKPWIYDDGKLYELLIKRLWPILIGSKKLEHIPNPTSRPLDYHLLDHKLDDVKERIVRCAANEFEDVAARVCTSKHAPEVAILEIYPTPLSTNSKFLYFLLKVALSHFCPPRFGPKHGFQTQAAWDYFFDDAVIRKYLFEEKYGEKVGINHGILDS